jgi:hypothetical protein
MMLNLVPQNPPGRDIIAVAEPAGHAENLKLLERAGAFQQPVDMQRFRLRARLLEGKRRFLFAIRAGSTQNQYVGLGHYDVWRKWFRLISYHPGH